jgi:hypothetical protein
MIVESDLSKLTRWIVPGWVALLSFLFFISVDMIHGDILKPDIYESLLNSLGNAIGENSIMNSLLIAASGIPIGFIVYQIYFYIRWNAPLSCHGLIPGFSSGRMDENDEILSNCSEAQNKYLDNMREKFGYTDDDKYKSDHKYHWRFIELLFTDSCKTQDNDRSTVSFYARYRYLHEITHTLGASTVAIVLGFLCYMVLKIIKTDVSFPPLIIFIVFVIICFFYVCLVLEISSEKKSHQEKYTHQGLKFITALIIVNSLFNPLLDIITQGAKIMILILFLFVWIISTILREKLSDKKVNIKSLIGYLFIIISLTVLQLFKRRLIFINNIDWAFLSNLLLLLLGSLILVKNRNNAYNDLKALESFVIFQSIKRKDSK